MENISASPDKESDYPVLSTPDVVVYHEQIDSFTSDDGSGGLVISPVIIIDTIWTEEVIPDYL